MSFSNFGIGIFIISSGLSATAKSLREASLVV
jgi:hypothetical protein